MIKPENVKLLEDLGQTQFGEALKEYLEEEKLKIGNIRSTKSWEETLGRQFALDAIEDLFHFMKEKKELARGKKIYE